MPQIDPNTGEVVQSTPSVQIDPATGEIVTKATPQDKPSFMGSYMSRLENNAEGLVKPLLHPLDSIMSYGGFKNPADQGGPIQDIIQNPDKKAGAANAAADLTPGIALGGASKMAGAGFEAATKGIGKGLQYASASPESLKVAATRAITPGTPGELLTRALKPPVTAPDFETSIEKTLPRIAAQKPT
jgi:hypothetical protein